MPPELLSTRCTTAGSTTFIMSIAWNNAYVSWGLPPSSARACSGELAASDFIWVRMSSSWFGGSDAIVWEMASADGTPGGSATPGGSGGRPARELAPPSPRRAPPSLIGSCSAKSSRSGRPPTSTSFRFRTADAAVSGSAPVSARSI